MKIKLKRKEIKQIVIAAAGTGGHIMPAMAVANYFYQKNYKVIWLGTPNGMENELVSKERFKFTSINITGFRGKNILSLLSYPIKLAIASIKSILLLRKYNNASVLVFGGYISLPIGIAAIMLRKRLYMHEQNAIFGTSNKILAPFATKIFSAFEINTKYLVEVIGNPLRSSILKVNETLKSEKRLNILVVGGSLGAKIFNEKLPRILSKIKNINITHQCGRGKLNTVSKDYNSKVKVVEFIADIIEYYEWADIVIARAGAGTVSELEHLGIPAIFIPYPFAIDNHQLINAKTVVNKGGAILCEEKDIDHDLPVILENISIDQCLCMSKKIKSTRHKHAVEVLFKAITNYEKQD